MEEVEQKIKDLITQLEVKFPYKVRRIRYRWWNADLSTYCTKKGMLFEQSNEE